MVITNAPAPQASDRVNFKRIAADALAQSARVVEHWLPDGKREGSEWVARNPRRADRNPGSFKVNLESGKWSDFACDAAGGDLVALIAYINGCTQKEAAEKIAEFFEIPLFAGSIGHTGNKSRKASRGEPVAEQIPGTNFGHNPVTGGAQPGNGSKVVFPIPPDAPPPPPSYPQFGKPSACWTYRDTGGDALCHQCRFDPASGAKEFRPLSLWKDLTGTYQWLWKGLPEPRPLYNLDQLAKRSDAPVLICEGEKAADAATKLYPDYVCTTSMGGAQSAAKTDWKALAGRVVTIWPDADEPGGKYADEVIALLQKVGAAKIGAIDLKSLAQGLGLDMLTQGYDAADALADGITADRIVIAYPQPPAMLAPGFDLDGEGVWHASTNHKGELSRHWICSPLRVVGHTCGPDGRDSGRVLELTDLRGQTQKFVLPMRMLAGSAEELRSELLDRGLGITHKSIDRVLLSAYIQDAPRRRLITCVKQVGWHDGAFVLPGRAIGRDDVIYQGAAQIEGLELRGSLDEWKSRVAQPCRGNSRLIFAVSASFGSVLVEIVGGESAVFHYRGRSSEGKTTKIRVAASIWGSPKFWRSWRTTSNHLEALAALLNNLPLLLDELKQIEPAQAESVAYLLGNGCGKGRANRNGDARAVQRFAMIAQSTGELSLAQHIGRATRAGEDVRVLDVPADAGASLGVFETLHGRTDGATFADELKANVAQAYGTAGPAFLQCAIANLDRIPKAWAEYESTFSESNVTAGASGQARRVCKHFALVGFAGELATACGTTGWDEGEATAAAERLFQDWLAARGGDGMQESATILAQVRLFLEQHGDSRFTPLDANGNKDDALRTINRAGFRRQGTGSDEIEFLVLPEVFKAEIAKGFDPKLVRKVLKDAGYLKPVDESHDTQNIRLPEINQKRVYVINGKILNHENAG